jgi:hypothetical protein
MSDPDQRSMGVEYRIRASPTSSPEEIVNQLVAQLVPYLRQVFSQYTVVYRVRVIIQPVFVRTPKPPVTLSVVTRAPVRDSDMDGGGNDELEEEEEE